MVEYVEKLGVGCLREYVESCVVNSLSCCVRSLVVLVEYRVCEVE